MFVGYVDIDIRSIVGECSFVPRIGHDVKMFVKHQGEEYSYGTAHGFHLTGVEYLGAGYSQMRIPLFVIHNTRRYIFMEPGKYTIRVVVSMYVSQKGVVCAESNEVSLDVYEVPNNEEYSKIAKYMPHGNRMLSCTLEREKIDNGDYGAMKAEAELIYELYSVEAAVAANRIRAGESVYGGYVLGNDEEVVVEKVENMLAGWEIHKSMMVLLR
jgi:hypothetical protein